MPQSLLCPSPVMSLSRCDPALLRPSPVMSLSRCVPFLSCPSPVVSLSCHVLVLLRPSPVMSFFFVMSQSCYVPVPLCSNPNAYQFLTVLRLGLGLRFRVKGLELGCRLKIGFHVGYHVTGTQLDFWTRGKWDTMGQVHYRTRTRAVAPGFGHSQSRLLISHPFFFFFAAGKWVWNC